MKFVFDFSEMLLLGLAASGAFLYLYMRILFILKCKMPPNERRICIIGESVLTVVFVVTIALILRAP